VQGILHSAGLLATDGCQEFSVPPVVHTCCGAPPASCTVGMGGGGAKWQRHEADIQLVPKLRKGTSVLPLPP
jgi:hypothetical protein